MALGHLADGHGPSAHGTLMILPGLGRVLRDGVVLMLSIAMAALALGFTALLGWLAWLAWHRGLVPLLRWLPG